MQRTDELPGLRKLPIELRSRLQRIRHRWIAIRRIRHAACLAIVETELLSRRRTQIQGRERVDLACVRDRRDGTENAFGLVHALPVVCLDAVQILAYQLLRGELPRHHRRMHVANTRFDDLELGRH